MQGTPPANLLVEQIVVWGFLALHQNGSNLQVQEGGEVLPRLSYALSPNAIIVRANLPLQSGWPGQTGPLWVRVGELIQGDSPF